jgi:hypothetical protein
MSHQVYPSSESGTTDSSNSRYHITCCSGRNWKFLREAQVANLFSVARKRKSNKGI